METHQSDRRVEAVSQMMNVIRMIKLFAWERKSLEKLAGMREEELGWIRYEALLELISRNMVMVCCSTFRRVQTASLKEWNRSYRRSIPW